MTDVRLGVHPYLLTAIDRVLAAMTAFGCPMRICQGVRTVDQQHALWRQGRDLPGHIVTNADGVTVRSNHQVHPDGLGHAVDCCFRLGDPFGEHQPWAAYGALVEAAGLRWGGRFVLTGGTRDRPHAELSPTS